MAKYIGILPHGGTILGTSRDKPHKMAMGDETRDMTDSGPAWEIEEFTITLRRGILQ
ncbi:MAG: hypothetical protein ABI614_12895 [Planctomycetota bacterium]